MKKEDYFIIVVISLLAVIGLFQINITTAQDMFVEGITRLPIDISTMLANNATPSPYMLKSEQEIQIKSLDNAIKIYQDEKNKTWFIKYIGGVGGVGESTGSTGMEVHTLDGSWHIGLLGMERISGLQGLEDAQNNSINSKTTLNDVNSSAQVTRAQVTGQTGVDDIQNRSISDLQTNDTSPKYTSFQTDFYNETFTDEITIPYNLTLNNIKSIIKNTTNSSNWLLNFSIEKYSSYPSSKIKILNYSFYGNTENIDSIGYIFYENDIIEINYTTYQNITKASTTFIFKVR